MHCVLAERAKIEREAGNHVFADNLDLWSGIIHDSSFPLQWAYDQSPIESADLWPILDALSQYPYSTEGHEKMILWSPGYGWRLLSHAPEKRAHHSAPIRSNTLPPHCSIIGGGNPRPPSYADVFEWNSWNAGLTKYEAEKIEEENKRRAERAREHALAEEKGEQRELDKSFLHAHTPADMRKRMDHFQTGQPYFDMIGTGAVVEKEPEPEPAQLPDSLTEHANDCRVVECVRILREDGKDDAYISRRVGRALKHKKGMAHGLTDLRAKLGAKSDSASDEDS